MIMKERSILMGIVLTLSLFSCKEEEVMPPLSDAEIIHKNVNQATNLIVYDVFSPPVASRIYAYTSLAAYEAVRFSDSGYNSIAAKLKGFGELPEPESGKDYDFTLAATKAFFTVARTMTFSVDSFVNYENRIDDQFRRTLDEEEYKRSVSFGKQVGEAILKRAAKDNYTVSRSKPKHLGSNDAGKWRPTPPDYFDGVEYCWGDMMTFSLDSINQFPVGPPIPYSEDTTSEFFKANMEVYTTANSLTEEQMEIATFWDDNPFVMEHSGHMMFANKKITPGGHWIGITEIACKKSGAGAAKSAKAYALVSIALFDSFVTCWKEKYTANVIRPVSVINEKVDPEWMPFLQTPPFPEYPSGHSTITRAAATVLTGIFGDNFSFEDTSDMKYIGMKRNFDSFVQAADEASISRLYGGIHVRHSLNEGAEQGRRIGEHILRKYNLTAKR